MVAPDILRQRMQATGIGFAGLEGVWWLPANNPFHLPQTMQADLEEISRALFLLFDTVQDLYRPGTTDSLEQTLTHKVPERIRRLANQRGRLLSIRPDFQLQPGPEGLRPVVTELEICPSAQGFAHAMQVAYGLESDLVACTARFLAGRRLLIVGSADWSEFLFEQLAFCRALEELGAQGQVIYDRSLENLAQEINRGQRWQPPIFGVDSKPAGWNDDLIGRIKAGRWHRYILPGALPSKLPPDTLVFRFGYFDNFSAETLDLMAEWEEAGIVFINPPIFFLENKALMVAARLPTVRDRIETISPGTLAILDRCIPETQLLTGTMLARLRMEKDDWVIKYAGYDGGNQAWGGRSLEVGSNHTPESWKRVLRRCLTLPWPTVAQKAVPSARIDIAYFDSEDRVRKLKDGTTRLRAFMIRDGKQGAEPGERAAVCGAHLTISGGGDRVSEGVDAVQTPVIFDQ